jgi:5'-nucleotidase (lipoprotein e(P4) family)
MRHFALTLVVLSLSASCATPPKYDPSEYKLNATLFMQTAAEYRALCYQAYNVARDVLDRDLRTKKPGKRAIVVDIDETILDNSAQQGRLHHLRQTYTSEAWKAWTDLGKAAAVPGSVEFLQYATTKGARVFYVTSRKDNERAGTLKNLRDLHFPLQDEADLMTRSSGNTSKEARRQAIEKMGYRIVLLAGDNLGDHSVDFDAKSVEDRAKAADAHRADFDAKFIVLPNPIYSDWESAIYGGWDPKQSEDTRREMRQQALRDYQD